MRLRWVLYGLLVMVIVIGSVRSRGEPLVPLWIAALALIFGLVLLIVVQIGTFRYATRPDQDESPKL
jgi:uncharacterized protein with PQ loop repeat